MLWNTWVFGHQRFGTYHAMCYLWLSFRVQIVFYGPQHGCQNKQDCKMTLCCQLHELHWCLGKCEVLIQSNCFEHGAKDWKAGGLSLEGLGTPPMPPSERCCWIRSWCFQGTNQLGFVLLLWCFLTWTGFGSRQLDCGNGRNFAEIREFSPLGFSHPICHEWFLA